MWSISWALALRHITPLQLATNHPVQPRNPVQLRNAQHMLVGKLLIRTDLYVSFVMETQCFRGVLAGAVLVGTPVKRQRESASAIEQLVIQPWIHHHVGVHHHCHGPRLCDVFWRERRTRPWRWRRRLLTPRLHHGPGRTAVIRNRHNFHPRCVVCAIFTQARLYHPAV